jgi:multiple sugar transport system substrate-binding protein
MSTKRRRGNSQGSRAVALGAVCVLLAALVGCGVGDSGSSSGRTLNWYVFNEPGGANEQAIKTCNEEANGRYKIRYQRLPTDANQQRELIVRRLAAEDSTVDLVGMDVIWTAEFAEAGWILPWEGARRSEAIKGKVEGPRKTVEYKNKVWGIPFTTNTQLLFFRKDRVKRPGERFTWNEMIDQAAKSGKAVEVQAAQYEGYTVWINSLIAGAGGKIADQSGDVKVDQTAGTAAEIIKRLATSKAAPPGMATNKEDQARLGFETGRSNYQVNYTFIYPSAAMVKSPKDFQKRIGWARYPRTEADKPSRPPLGGINIGVGAYTKHRDLAFEAARCLAQPKNQVVASEKGGLPPTTESEYDNPKVKKALPFSDLLRESIESGAPRPVNPAYSDISLAIQKTYHPPDQIKPGEIVTKLQDRMDKAAEGKVF